MNLEYFQSGSFTYRLPGELRIYICCYCDRVCVDDYDSQPDYIRKQIHRLGGKVVYCRPRQGYGTSCGTGINWPGWSNKSK